MNKKILRIIKDPLKIIRPLGSRGFFNWMPDKPYLKLVYRGETGKKLDLRNPKTYNEKLQWLKLYNRNQEYSNYVDKFAVRSYIRETIGGQYLVPLIGVYNNVEEIEWDKLPKRFVLKCTHGSGTNIICENKDDLDINAAEKKLNRWMKKSWYWFGREWPYKNVKPKIICEKYMLDESGQQLKDYRLFCFNGAPKFIAVDLNIIDKSKTKRNLYDLQWNLMEEGISYPRELEVKIEKPKKLDEMIQLSKALAKNIPHVRIDFYSIDEKLYFGEMTFFHQVGFGKIYPQEFDKKMGEWIVLPRS